MTVDVAGAEVKITASEGEVVVSTVGFGEQTLTSNEARQIAEKLVIAAWKADKD